MPAPARLVVSCVDFPLPDGPQDIIVRAFDAQTHIEVTGEVSINGEHRVDMITNRAFHWTLRSSDEAVVCVDGFAPVTCALTVCP
jgi:hypothetical protein